MKMKKPRDFDECLKSMLACLNVDSDFRDADFIKKAIGLSIGHYTQTKYLFSVERIPEEREHLKRLSKKSSEFREELDKVLSKFPYFDDRSYELQNFLKFYKNNHHRWDTLLRSLESFEDDVTTIESQIPNSKGKENQNPYYEYVYCLIAIFEKFNRWHESNEDESYIRSMPYNFVDDGLKYIEINDPKNLDRLIAKAKRYHSEVVFFDFFYVNQFTVSDIFDWPHFLNILMQDSKKDFLNPGKVIWNSLTDDVKDTINKSLQITKLSIEDKEIIRNGLNALLNQRDFFQKMKEIDISNFPDNAFKLEEEITSLERYCEDPIGEVQQLNRLLIEWAYPDEIKRTKSTSVLLYLFKIILILIAMVSRFLQAEKNLSLNKSTL